MKRSLSYKAVNGLGYAPAADTAFYDASGAILAAVAANLQSETYYNAAKVRGDEIAKYAYNSTWARPMSATSRSTTTKKNRR